MTVARFQGVPDVLDLIFRLAGPDGVATARRVAPHWAAVVPTCSQILAKASLARSGAGARKGERGGASDRKFAI